MACPTISYRILGENPLICERVPEQFAYYMFHFRLRRRCPSSFDWVGFQFGSPHFPHTNQESSRNLDAIPNGS